MTYHSMVTRMTVGKKDGEISTKTQVEILNDILLIYQAGRGSIEVDSQSWPAIREAADDMIYRMRLEKEKQEREQNDSCNQ